MDQAIRESTRLWTLALPAVSAFVTSLVRDFQDRDEVLQDTAIAVMESFGRYDPMKPFVAWAIGIARNQVLLYLRRKGRERLVFDTDAVAALANAFGEAPSTDVRLDFLIQCMEKMERTAREICRLRYEQDLKPMEIGQRLGMTPNGVAKSLQRVRDLLRECIKRKTSEAGA